MAACAILAHSESALGAGKVSVSLSIQGCPHLQNAEVMRVLRAELRVDVTTRAGEPTLVSARCSGERLAIEVSDAISRKLVRRNFALRDPEHPGMSRLVGVAAAELVLASWAELSLIPNPRVEPEGPRPSPEVLVSARQRVMSPPPPQPAPAQPPAPAPASANGPPATGSSVPVLDARAAIPNPAELPTFEPRDDPDDWSTAEPVGPRLRFIALGSGRGFFEHTGALWGGGLRIGGEPFPFVSWAADAFFETGAFELPEREVELDAWTLGGHLYAHYRYREVTVRAGAGLRAGLAASRTKTPDTRERGARAFVPWGWPLLAANVSGYFAPSFSIEVAGEASYAVIPIATGARGDSVRGTWIGVQIGLAWMPNPGVPTQIREPIQETEHTEVKNEPRPRRPPGRARRRR